MDHDYHNIATKIVEKGSYMTIGTSNGFEPWIAPVAYWTDDDNCFYFVSHKESKHVTHIAINPKVAISIFDSSIPEGKGDKSGIQISAFAKILAFDDNTLITKALHSIQYRFSSPTDTTLKEFTDRCILWYKNDRVIVKLIPDDIFLNSYDGKKDYRIHVKFNRVIDLSQFRSKL